MKRHLFNLTALLSLLLCSLTAGVFFLGGLIRPRFPRSWVLNLPNGYSLFFNRDELMLQNGHGGFPVAEVFYMWIVIPAAILPMWWLINWIKQRDQTPSRSGFPVVRHGEGDNRAARSAPAADLAHFPMALDGTGNAD